MFLTQNVPEQNVPEQNVPEQNVLEQNVPEQNVQENIRAKESGSNSRLKKKQPNFIRVTKENAIGGVYGRYREHQNNI